jgi:DNA-binding NarL/FixJ family response regulator
MANPYRILLVDDHEVFRAGIVSVLEHQEGIEIVGEASDGFEALTLIRDLLPDLILMDINMPICNGLSALRTVKREMPEIKVVMMTVSEEDDDVFQAVKEGADGYLLKNLGRQKLLDAILRLRKGEAVVSGVLAARILRELRRPDPGTKQEVAQDELTTREMDVLMRIAAGDSNKQIAKTLCIAENTVKIHVANILAKLHLRNRVEAAVFAVREGLKPESDNE